MKRLLLILVVIFIGGVLTVSGSPKQKIKVVSLAPSLTETIFHLGKGDCLVGRSSADDYPESAKKLPIAGKFGIPSLEQLAILKPDVVVAASLQDKSMKNSIEAMGIKIFLLPTVSIENYYHAVEALGEILDCKDISDAEIKRIKNALNKMELRNKGRTAPKVYLEVWNSPIMTIGKKSFLNDFISYAGGKNIGADMDKDYIKCSQEWVILANPEVIICPAMGEGKSGEVIARYGWQNIPAVKNKHVFTHLNQDLIYRLGPRMLDGIAIIRKCIESADSK